MNKFYITTAIPYVNAAPHIGHAYEFVITDAIARYHRQILGNDRVLLLTGADENALKNVQAAEKQGITTQELCDINSEKFKELLDLLNVKYNVFQRGSDQKKHWPGVQKLWQLCQKSGDIYKKTYSGLYCVGCEAFYSAKELVDGLCPVHKIKPDLVEEENYFFRLSRYQQQLEDIVTTDQIKIYPQERKNETLAFIRQGLEDISISRSNQRAKDWGVPVPGDTSQIVYVWFDALDIYQTGVGFGYDDNSYNKWWPANVHVIGKDIYRFHTIYWPAILLSAKLPRPKQILIHGFLNVGGEKMSKTLGNVVEPFEFINDLKSRGVELAVDALRYYLLTQPIFYDGDFSWDRFKAVYNADLANGLGNLVSRVAKLCETNKLSHLDEERTIADPVSERIEQYRFNDALGVIWAVISEADKSLTKDRPWESGGNLLNELLNKQVRRIKQIAADLQPFLPATADKILKQFSGQIQSQAPLFPRLP